MKNLNSLIDMAEGSAPSKGKDFQLDVVGFPLRAGARIFDLALYSILGFAIWLVLALLLHVLNIEGLPAAYGIFESFRNISGPPSAAASIGLIAFFLSMPLSWIIATSICGMTIGKLICGLIVVKEDGSFINFWDVVLREIAFYIDAVFYGMVASLTMRDSEKQQRIGDKWAHTVVARRASLATKSLPTKRRIVVGIGLSVLISFIGYAAYAVL